MAKIDLTVQEALKYAMESARWDGFAEGARAAAEMGKKTVLQSILENRKIKQEDVKNDTIAQPEHAAEGHAAHGSDEPVPEVQSEGSGDEPERASASSDGWPADESASGPVFPISGTAEPWIASAFGAK